MESIRLYEGIKMLIYTGGTFDLHRRHNRAMAHKKLANQYQECSQDIQEFRDQYIAMRKGCDKLEVNVKVSQRQYLNRKELKSSTQEELINAMDLPVVEEVHHTIMF